MQNLCQCWCHPTANKSVTGPQYHNLDTVVELIWRINEADIVVGDIQVMALIATGALVSTISQDFCEEHGYEIYLLKQMLHLEGTAEFTIPYLGYIEATVKIPPIKGYDECIPMLVLKSSHYSSRVPIQLGTTVLDRAMAKYHCGRVGSCQQHLVTDLLWSLP